MVETEELTQNYIVSKWFEIGIQLIRFLPESWRVTPALDSHEVPAFFFTGSPVHKSCRQLLWYFHTYKTFNKGTQPLTKAMTVHYQQ